MRWGRLPAVHDVPAHEALVLLESERGHGLTASAVDVRLRRFGPNALPKAHGRSALRRLASQFNHPLIYILLVAAGVAAAVGETVDASVILGVVVVNAVIGFLQEGRAENALEALAEMVVGEVSVLRDGRRMRVPATHVVPGDLLVLAPGDAVVADARIVEVHGLQVDESALTGESLPVAKDEIVLASETPVADRTNMAFAGTLVTSGNATGVVVATGGQTELGLIHRLIGETAQIATPLTRKIADFSKVLTVAILALAALTYLIGLARGEDPADLLVAAVALAVGAIPEGLPAAVTITLAIGVSRMAGRNAIVRQLPAVETLGSTTVICTDKTGTLTENQMTVSEILTGGRRYRVTGTGYAPEGDIQDDETGLAPGAAIALRACLETGVLCNDARLTEHERRWTAVGDPTEAALVAVAEKYGIHQRELTSLRPRLDEIPFESERQFMVTLHGGADTGKPTVHVKGAVERVLDLCTDALGDDGQPAVLDDERVHADAARLARGGLRVLAFAQGDAPEHTDALAPEMQPTGLTFLGLQGMIDPPRPQATASVDACRNAGIAVKMITGDHALTAEAIARQIGIVDPGGESQVPVMTGTEIARCDQHQLRAAVRNTAVFARVSPEQKLALVDALQANGDIVAMTGDGVNDAPALRQADIGVAMGHSGTEVAREAADIVLTDDNFASIEAAVEEGRRTFDNLTKFIVWTLPTNLGEGLVILTAIASAVTLPILPVQILWINMTTAVALGLMLAFEPREPGIMERPPRDPRRPLLTPELLGRIALVGALLLVAAFGLFEWERSRGVPDAEARTVAVNVFVIVELFYLLNCRSLERSVFRIGLFSNRWVNGGIIVMIALQLLFTYAPFMNTAFQSAPIDAAAWARIIGAGVIAWLIVGAEKLLRQRRRPSCTPAVHPPREPNGDEGTRGT